MPNFLDDRADIAWRASAELKLANTVIASGYDLGFEIRTLENKLLASPDFSAGAHERFPQIGCESAGEQNLNAGP